MSTVSRGNEAPTERLLSSPPRFLWEPMIRRAFEEDLGTAGDLTTQSIVPQTATATARIRSRAAGIVAGVEVAAGTFKLYDPELSVHILVADGDRIAAQQVLLELEGSARSILIAERTALNLLGRLCGIASATDRLATLIAGTRAQVVCTRKTTPGLRALEKYAVRCGGGGNHRFGLDDAVLIKDNHIAVAGGVAEAIRSARSHVGHLVKIEVEVDTLDQLETALESGAEAVLLDNMPPETLRVAVERCRGKVLTEASGGINASTIRAVAESGVDLISVGALTHSVKVLDLGLDIDL